MGVFKSKYNFGDVVYLKTDPDQLPRMISDIKFSPDCHTIYFLACGTICTEHYELEISESKNKLMSLGIEKNMQ
jgi:hypothetical protein